MSKIKTTIIEKKFREILPFTLVLVYREDKSFKKTLNKVSNKYPELKECNSENIDDCAAFVFSTGNSNIFLFFTKEFYLGTLAHECIHIIFYIFERLGIKISNDSEEVFAYLMDTLYSYIYDTCKNLGLILDTQKYTTDSEMINAI